MPDYIMTVRAPEPDGSFGEDVAQDVTFLSVPDGSTDFDTKTPTLISSAWYAQVIHAGSWANANNEARGDILFIVHGYNMSTQEVLQRHNLIKNDLSALGFKGVVVSFDWPTQNQALAYLPDRHAAKETAFRLVDEGIRELSDRQTPTCPINIHILAHSTGAYVVREAFDDAEDTQLPDQCWTVSEIAFIAGDVSSDSMSGSDGIAEAIYRHCVRLTNYSNRYDAALGISNVKRLGVAPRVGRIGLPDDAPAKSLNIDCTDYYNQWSNNDALQKADSPNGHYGLISHSWYFGNKVFASDLFQVLIGTDRVLPDTRHELTPPLTNRFVLQRPDAWPAPGVAAPAPAPGP
ncbi:alpha/beta hydrolase [Paraburkholderia sp. A1RO-5]|uniref:alpha/beta hydrolase n=1 Tax=Paraburkholderia sp. A1RO-5 TaxID=3028369 RepID=UPI003B79E5FC